MSTKRTMTQESTSQLTIKSEGRTRSEGHAAEEGARARRSPPRWSARWLYSVAVLAGMALLSGCGHRTDRSQGVQLVLTTAELGPTTTFELRFEEPMARGKMIGTEAQVCPLLLTPRVPGHFVYTSARSGVFTPEEPLALGTEYELQLRPALTRADGRPASATLYRRLRTPAFGVVNCFGPPASTNATSEPEYHVWFNANIKAADISFLAGFANAEGLQVPALARQGTEEDQGYYWWNGSRVKTWQQSFEEQRRTSPGRGARARSVPPAPTNQIGNLVMVTPAQPLAVGHDWKLVLASGVVSADGQWRSGAKFETTLGDVLPFSFNEATVHHVINQAPRVRLDFSKKLPATLTNAFTNWVQISPWPADLKAEVSGAALSLSGAWQRRTPYQLTVRRGFPAEEAFTLAAPETLRVDMPPVDPRLYFPAFATEQYAGGQRFFPLLAVNVDRIRVRAKLLEPGTAIHALRGYRSYFPKAGPRAYADQGYDRLDYNLVPGRSVFNEEMAGPKREDVAEELGLHWDRLLNGRKAGVVFVEAERIGSGADGEPVLGTQALVQLTDLGLVWKSGSSNLDVLVFSYTSGQPIPHVQVQLFSDENEPLRAATSSPDGLARLNLHTNATWLVAQAGEDFHAVKLREHNIQPGSLGVPVRWEPNEEEASRRVALFTDRDVYRPGEIVHWKAVVRDLSAGGASIPAGLSGTLACSDARGRHVFETNVVFNALGSATASIELGSGPRGSYDLVLTLEGRARSHAITVADYEPAAFAIEILAQPEYGSDESIALPVSARYFFGQRLHRAHVRWSLEAADSPIAPKGFETFSFSRAPLETQWGRGSGTFAVNGEGRLSAGSNYVIQAEVPLNPVAIQPRTVTLWAEVTDLNEQTLTHSVSFLKHSSAFYLGLKNFEEVLEPGRELPIEIAAVGADQMPWSAPVQAHLTLQRVEWETVRLQGAGRTVRYRSQATLTNVLEREVTITPPLKLAAPEKGYAGARVAGISAAEAGPYVLEVRARDGHGHEVASSLSFSVTDRARLAWNYRNEVEIKLSPDKASYRPGETALILAKTPISGAAWVTVESEGVDRTFLTQLEGNAPAVRVPIQASDAPNVFVSLTVLRGAALSPHQTREPEYRVGYCQLNVEDPQTRLQVEVASSRTNYLPGELVEAEARVANAAGEPVRGAEVTLYAVDEGVLSLTDYAVPDLHSLIYVPRLLAVESGITLPFLLPEDPKQLAFQNKGYVGGGGGNESVRQRFLACAFWNATLQSDGQGRVTGQFTAPDSLTRYRLIAVAHTVSSQFGSGTAGFTISKPLIVQPALPQFANLADHLQARAVLLNQTDHAGDVLVSLELDDKAQAMASGQLSQRVRLAAHGSAIMEVPVRLVETGVARWNWRARFADVSVGSFTDAVRSTLQIGDIMPLLRETALVRAEPGETNLLAGINPQVLAGSGTISVTVAGTRLVELGEAVAQLLHYPYGCAEQTGSSLLPWLVLENTPELIPFTGRGTNEAARAAQAGIQRLFSMQTRTGGLAYWPGGGEPMLWASAYGAFILALADSAGLDVPGEDYRRLLVYLSGQLRQPSDGPLGDRCLALYALALAGTPEPAYHEKLFEQRAHLSAEDRALLALAIVKSSGTNSMTEELLRANLPRPQTSSSWFGCERREQAIALLARLACRPNDPENRTLFGRLEQEQRTQWFTTQGNAWALLAMREYLQRTETHAEPGAGTLRWGGESIPFTLAPEHGVLAHTFVLRPDEAAHALRLHTASTTPLFVQLTVESRSQATHHLSENHGFALQRRYDRLTDENEPTRFDHLQVGDRVLVTLRLTTQQVANYVAVDDPLPSVLEPVNSEFKTQQLGPTAGAAWLTDDDAENWWSDFRETRQDRMLFFADHLAPGSYLIRYLARVRASGTVTAPTAKAEEMYHPERFGLAETQVLTSQALDTNR